MGELAPWVCEKMSESARRLYATEGQLRVDSSLHEIRSSFLGL